MKIPLLISLLFLTFVALFGFYIPVARFSTSEGCKSEPEQVRIFRTLAFMDTVKSIMDKEFKSKVDVSAPKPILSTSFGKKVSESCNSYEVYLF